MRSTFRILFYLKYGAASSDGKLPLMCRITVDGESTSFSCKIRVPKADWNARLEHIQSKDPESEKINNILDAMRARLYSIYFEQMQAKGYTTPMAIKNTFLGIDLKQKTLLKYFEGHVSMLSREIGYRYSRSTYNRYSIVFRYLSSYLTDIHKLNDIPLNEIDLHFIDGFADYLKKHKKCETNTVWCYISALKHIVALATSDGLIRKNPFSGYRNRFIQVDRGYLTQEELVRLSEYQTRTPIDALVRDMFLFSCFTGLSYADIKHLSHDNLVKRDDGRLWISLRRHKTNTLSTVRLLDLPLSILHKYKRRRKYILPIPSNNCCNEHLKVMEKECKFGIRLTFHIARHTFATMSLTEGMPIESISNVLGHTNIKTTQIYAKITNQKLNRDFDLFSKAVSPLEYEIISNTKL